MPLADIEIPSRVQHMAEQRGLGRKVFGVFPAQYPAEILWAHGILPVEIWDPPLEPRRAAGHLQPYICSVVRQGLELILASGCDGLDGLLFPHTCDSLQNFASLVHDYFQAPAPCYFFYHPKEPFRESARIYYREQLEALDRSLERQFGPRPAGTLEQAVAWGERIAALAGEIYALRAEGGLDVSNQEFYRVLRAGEYLHPEAFIPLLEDFLAGAAGPAPSQPALVLSGILPNPKGVLQVMDELGVRVGHDDFLALGRRLLRPAADAGDPWQAMTQAYFSLPPCSTRGSSLEDRLAWLMNLTGQSSAKGVVFYITKFCEPELFDAPALAAGLKERGLGAITLEVELNQPLGGAVATRVEALVEMLS